MEDETKTPQPENEEFIQSDDKTAQPESQEIQPEPLPPTEEQPPSTPTFMDKVKHWAIYALIGLVVVALIFLAGFLTSYFTNVRPLQASLAFQGEELSQIQIKLDSLESRNNELSASLSSEKTKAAALEDEIETLQAGLEMAEMHLLLLRTVNDFNTANLALSNGDISGAKVALLATPERIQTLLPLIETVDTPLAKNLENRFEMILSNLEDDSQTAQFDLGLLAKSLLNVEALLFAP